MVASAADLLIIATLTTQGILMKALPVAVVAVLFAINVVFCFVLDAIKGQVFNRLQLADVGTT
jgi:uncharacterized membrane protein